MKFGSVAPAAKSFAHGTRTNICCHMRKNRIIPWACRFQIYHSGASSAMPIWMSMPFPSYIACIGLLMSQSSVISPVFPAQAVVPPLDLERQVVQDEIDRGKCENGHLWTEFSRHL